jgi:hypothetical protein
MAVTDRRVEDRVFEPIESHVVSYHDNGKPNYVLQFGWLRLRDGRIVEAVRNQYNFPNGRMNPRGTSTIAVIDFRQLEAFLNRLMDKLASGTLPKPE